MPIPATYSIAQHADAPPPLLPDEPDLLADGGEGQDAEAEEGGETCPCGCGGTGENEDHMLVPDVHNGFHDGGGVRIYNYYGRCMHAFERCDHEGGCTGDAWRDCCDLFIYVSFTPDWRIRRIRFAGHFKGRPFSFPPECDDPDCGGHHGGDDATQEEEREDEPAADAPVADPVSVPNCIPEPFDSGDDEIDRLLDGAYDMTLQRCGTSLLFAQSPMRWEESDLFRSALVFDDRWEVLGARQAAMSLSESLGGREFGGADGASLRSPSAPRDPARPAVRIDRSGLVDVDGSGVGAVRP